jgi:hypothetical protein
LPSVQAYQIVNADSATLGYSIEEPGSNSGHFVRIIGSPDPDELKSRVLRFACNFLVDLTPIEGLQELLERASEIREYYCSLANWQMPALAEPKTVPVNPSISSYERASFSYPEE